MTVEKMRARLEISPLEFAVGLIFGGLVILMFAFGGKPVSTAIMIFIAAAELYAFAELRLSNVEASRAGGCLRAAALLTIAAAALFLVPVVLSGHVKSCWECESYTDGGGHNFFGEFVLMWMAGAVAGVGALISWGISLVRLYGRAKITPS
jgi:hypothetical protein